MFREVLCGFVMETGLGSGDNLEEIREEWKDWKMRWNWTFWMDGVASIKKERNQGGSRRSRRSRRRRLSKSPAMFSTFSS